jgi:hypothetical protein
MQARRFYLDTQARAFVGGFDRTFPASSSAFFDEDVEAIELYFLQPTDDPTQPYTALNYSSNTVKLAVGLTAPAALQTSWTALATAITPSVTVLTNGGSGASEVQKVSFSGASPSEGAFSLTIPARTLSSNNAATLNGNTISLANHGLLSGQVVQIGTIIIDNWTYDDGFWVVRNATRDTFQIAFSQESEALGNLETIEGDIVVSAITTPQIPWNANAGDVQAAFVSAGLAVLGVPQVVVLGSFRQGFTCSFVNSLANVNFGSMTASSTLAAPAGLTANLNFATNEIAALIQAGNTNNLRLEVEVSDGTRRQTYSTGASISADIIASSSAAPLPTITPASSFNITSPDSSVWNVTIDNTGILTATKV